MSLTPLEFARENGWAELLPRLFRGLLHRVRDGFTARRLKAPGFRAGRSPLLLGLAHMRIGRNFSAGDCLWLEAVISHAGERFTPELILGDDIGLSNSVHIACLQRIRIGSGLLCGSHVLISDHTHGAYIGSAQSDPATMPARRPLISKAGITIGRDVWLGDGVVVLAGAHIGDGAVIGAHSVVTGEIPDGTMAMGAPARPVRRWNADRSEWLPIDRVG